MVWFCSTESPGLTRRRLIFPERGDFNRSAFSSIPGSAEPHLFNLITLIHRNCDHQSRHRCFQLNSSRSLTLLRLQPANAFTFIYYLGCVGVALKQYCRNQESGKHRLPKDFPSLIAKIPAGRRCIKIHGVRFSIQLYMPVIQNFQLVFFFFD